MTTSVYRRTPSLTVSDSRGLAVRQIAYLRSVAGETAAAQVTRQQYDAAGRLLAQWDPRLSRPNLASVYGLGRAPLKVDSVDAGWRLSLPGLAGQALQRWDARGSHWRTTYDDQLRMVTVEENAQPDVETFTYANSAADAGHNLRGQLVEQLDPSGTLRFDSYGLLGQPLRETRTFHDDKAFASRRTYSPLGAVLEQIDAGDHRQQSYYDLAGQLKQVQLKINGQPGWQSVLQEAQYNAAGQVIEQQAGNGVISRWSYDPADARLQRQRAQKDQQSTLQDFEYVYDRVGNITRILDHVFTPRHFANQRVDGHREFSYDSLYRLHSASGYDDGPPSDIPGRPQPTDPNDRRNYTQTYEYDPGGNLIKLAHVREGASHTRQMFIDPASNRGVRWTPGDPAPSFDTLFDRHGNLQALQPGQGLHWNARDQLAAVTLVQRDNGPNDEEQYRYSQGARVYKRHDTHTATTSHFHEVRYLPGLEIRTRDNGEVLHVIILGNTRCLHWLAGKPPGIDADQLRYSLDDHLGSCLMELDQQARLISHEGYYPFGATAWMATRSALEVSYKTVRYSGKEMDVSGLYYYGARYYAPWLQRWVSADPAGDVDGLNLYGFVGNNPLRYIDVSGFSKTEKQMRGELKTFTSNLSVAKKIVNKQSSLLGNLFEDSDKNKAIGKNVAITVVTGAVTAGASIAGGIVGGMFGTVTLPLAGTIGGAAIGALAGKTAASESLKRLGKKINMEPGITPKAQKISWEEIKKKNIPALSVENAKSIYKENDPTTTEGKKNAFQKLVTTNLKKLINYGGPELIKLGTLAEEASDGQDGLSPMKLQRLDNAYVKILNDAEADFKVITENFAQEDIVIYSPAGLMSDEKMITAQSITNDMNAFRGNIERAREVIVRYKQRYGQAIS